MGTHSQCSRLTMKTRTRQTQRPVQDAYNQLSSQDLEVLSDEELEAFLFEEETRKSSGSFNLVTMAGLSMVLVGIVFLLEQVGLFGGFSLGGLVAWLPWMAGVLILLLGLGLVGRPRKKKKNKRRSVAARRKAGKATPATHQTKQQTTTRMSSSSRLRKSRDRKMAGVCGGIGEYFGIDPTIVRVAFVLGSVTTFFGAPIVPFAYLILAFAMSAPEKRSGATLPPKSRSGKTDITVTIIKDP